MPNGDENVDSELTSKQKSAIQAIARGCNLEDAALVAGVHARTLYRWQNNPAFVAELQRLQASNAQSHMVALTVELKRNRDVLVGARDDIDAPWHVRIRAAEALENSLLRWRQFAEFESRIAALEAMQA